MFDHPFPFEKINFQKRQEGEYEIISHNYAFYGKNRKRYIVIAEQFRYDVFAVKFYLKEHANCKHKFSRITGQHECPRILATIGRIMVNILESFPHASFVFVGSPSETEGKANTKRYRVYTKVTAAFIASVKFEHKTATDYSAYLLLNKGSTEQDLLQKVQDMFSVLYEYDNR